MRNVQHLLLRILRTVVNVFACESAVKLWEYIRDEVAFPHRKKAHIEWIHTVSQKGIKVNASVYVCFLLSLGQPLAMEHGLV